MKINRQTLIYGMLSCAIPVVILIAVFAGLHIAPFGEHTLVISDAKGLFVSDLGFFSRTFYGEEDLLYSFKSGIGMNTIALNHILLNPVNLIALAFDITDYASMYSWIVTASVALCGLTMFCFLSKVYGRDSGINLIFSTVYALMGFNVAYCFLYPFLFASALLPLIALGIRGIIEGARPMLYTAVMTIAILNSFYFGYILCFASALLCVMWCISDQRGERKRPSIKRVLLTYVVSTLCAGLLSAILWLPAILSLSGGRLDQNSLFDLSFNENMPLLDVFAKLFMGSNNTSELVNGLPNIFVGLFVVFLAIAFFVDTRNTKRKKIACAIPLAFYFLSFYIKAFSMALQGFSVTNWFNYRYSFVFSFVLIILARDEFTQFREIAVRDFKIVCMSLLILIIAVFSKSYSFVIAGEMLLDVLILALVLGAVWWNRIDEKRAPKGQMVAIVLLLCSLELYANFVISLSNLQEWEKGATELQEDTFNASVLSEAIQTSDNGFYRMVNEHGTNKSCNNDPRLLGYNGMNYFGSYERKHVFKDLSRYGAAWFSNRTWYAGGQPAAFDALFGLKYIIAQRNLTEEKGYESLVTVGADSVYLNPHTLPIGIFSQSSLPIDDIADEPFVNQNTLWRSLTGGNEDIFTVEDGITFTYKNDYGSKSTTTAQSQEYKASYVSKLESLQESDDSKDDDASGSEGVSASDGEDFESPWWIEYTFMAKQDGPIYSFYGAAVDEDAGYAEETMEYLGNYKRGDTVVGRIDLSAEPTIEQFELICSAQQVAYANAEVLAKYSKQLQEASGTLEKPTDSHLIGDVDAAQDGRLFFTIPYDEGWTLTVDGVEVVLENDARLFMSAPIASGAHHYELTFFPRGMKTGMAITGVGVVLLVVLVIYSIRDSKKQAA